MTSSQLNYICKTLYPDKATCIGTRGWGQYIFGGAQFITEPLSRPCIPPLSVITEHQAELPALDGSFLLTLYFTCGCKCVEYYSAIKRNEPGSSVVMQMDLESTIQSEVS